MVWTFLGLQQYMKQAVVSRPAEIYIFIHTSVTLALRNMFNGRKMSNSDMILFPKNQTKDEDKVFHEDRCTDHWIMAKLKPVKVQVLLAKVG